MRNHYTTQVLGDSKMRGMGATVALSQKVADLSFWLHCVEANVANVKRCLERARTPTSRETVVVDELSQMYLDRVRTGINRVRTEVDQLRNHHEEGLRSKFTNFWGVRFFDPLATSVCSAMSTPLGESGSVMQKTPASGGSLSGGKIDELARHLRQLENAVSCVRDGLRGQAFCSPGFSNDAELMRLQLDQIQKGLQLVRAEIAQLDPMSLASIDGGQS